MSKKKIDYSVPLTAVEKEFLDKMLAKLPPMLTRAMMYLATGGWLNPHTIRKEERRGNSPLIIYRVGKGKIMYETESLVEFGIRLFGVERLN